MKTSYKCYGIIDPEHNFGKPIEDIVQNMCLGGIDIIQLRVKNASTLEFITLAQKLIAISLYHNIPLLINDRVDVAMAIKAAGVHIGQNDMPVEMARALLGEHAIIGLTINSIDQMANAAHQHINYIGTGAVFCTQSKQVSDKIIGLDGLTNRVNAWRALSQKPIIAIGGISHQNASLALNTGVNGVAVLSSLSRAENVQRATQELKNLCA